MKMAFTEEERAVDESSGYPKAYAKLCKSPNVLNPYSHGPPYTFLPYLLQPQEALKIKELNEMFPIINPEAVPSINPKGFVNLLWKQLDHLGNAGFDPALFRVDPFGNVLYLHADSVSPLAWDIDHWFPCARGGKTVLSNLRIVNSQVRKKKGNKLEFLIPWWDLQIGISVNQFLTIFSSKNSDFRNRGFSFLFLNGLNEELNALQSVESHLFPHPFNEAKSKFGLAPLALVSTTRGSDAVLKQVDLNSSRSTRPTYPLIAAKKFSSEKTVSKENENPHFSIAMARDSLLQKNQTKKKNQSEIEDLDKEIFEMKEKNEEERVKIQDLEILLIEKRKRAEKLRHLAESQAQHKSLLEKMIRDAMHQNVIYKEQLRLNQAATSALFARLEAQRAICDSSENELRRRFKQRNKLETQIKGRKRSRIDLENNDFFDYGRKGRNLTGELRDLLEKEKRASEELEILKNCRGFNRRFSIVDEKSHRGEIESEMEEEEEEEERELQNCTIDSKSSNRRFSIVERGDLNAKLETLSLRDEKLQGYAIENEIEEEDEEEEEFLHEIDLKLKNRAIITERGESSKPKLQSSAIENEIEELEEEELTSEITERNNKLDGKGKGVIIQDEPLIPTIKKLQNCTINSSEVSEIEEAEVYMNQIGKGNVDKWLQLLVDNSEEHTVPVQENNIGTKINLVKREIERGGNFGRKSFDVKEKDSLVGLPISESSRAFRSLPSSPSKIILGMRKGVDCIGRKPKVIGDDEEYVDYSHHNGKFVKAIRKALIK